jgi:hypothetical protein
MGQTEFIAAIARRIAAAGRLSSPVAWEIATRVHRTFTTDNRIAHGDPGYEWTSHAAAVIATEYEIAYW